MKNDLDLHGIEVINTKTELKMKIDYFYEILFCYLYNFTHAKMVLI